MGLKNKINSFKNRAEAIVTDRRFVIGLYILVAILAATKQYLRGNFNNYLIFKHVYWHSKEFLDLYALYPNEYFDSNHYGPFFALLIAPFALLPDVVGMVSWNIVNVIVLCWGIYQLPISEKNRSWIAIIGVHETLTALLGFQFNIALVGLMLLSFSYIVKGKDIWGVVMILIGFLVKLYGIVGLAFFFFSKNKIRFVVAGLILLPILAFLPSIISTPTYVYDNYIGWYESLVEKNGQNITLSSRQDVSLMGIVRRISGDPTIPNTPFIAVGLLLFALPYLRIGQYKTQGFQLALLSSVLIFPVIFSSSSESPTYIIAMFGVAVWFMMKSAPRSPAQITLFVLAMLLTSFSPSDLFPKFVREEYIIPYSLKALPCVLVWFAIVYEMLTIDYKKSATV
ncbi:glycosyltransferase family 87 protein [Sphingobacterium yanglingense]|uniref:Uncharacterized protein DUF2029 n=1 Tax=Sphingobacterium yanglingense TaxID=1437280 RepID=A0A4R6WF62_9SPHI|nr:glycosyltransferase family 87 protein [Sphingobacterium yanglingense]TDQ76673.1 uncharacterized protein DUF2029 [Sphingobacterium yanglingense]